MRINHCLILAAGFGTRMGTIGLKLPKVLWPVFEKSILELQVAYAKSLGIEKIYINLHYMSDEIESFCKSRTGFNGVHFLRETPEILDIGGAIHNVASQPDVKYKGKLLVLNADQFFYIKQEELFKILAPYSKSPAVLFSYWVNSSDGYNALEVDSNRMIKKIVKFKDLLPNTKVETYTGISVIDLSQLSKVTGPSSFFETIAPYTQKEISSILLDNIDYWDFGTVNRFWDTSFRILETYRNRSTHPFLRFLVEEKALKTWKIDLNKCSYHSSSARVINLGSHHLAKPLNPSIVISDENVEIKEGRVIYWKDIIEEVK